MWFTLLSFTLTTYLIDFIDSVLKLYRTSQVICNVYLLEFCQSYNDMNEYHLLITHTYNYIYETKSRPSLSFPIMCKVLSIHNKFVKSAVILKISGTCIDYTFRNQSMLVKPIAFW